MTLSLQYLENLFLVSTRHSVVFFLVPAFGLRALPAPVRLGLAVLVSGAVLPPDSEGQAFVAADYRFFLAIGKELLVGGLLGFGILMTFAALQAAGTLADVQLGFGIPSILDPTYGGRDTPIGSFYNMLASFVFFATDAHHQVVLALRYLLEVVPVDSWSLSTSTVDSFLYLAAGMFAVALRIALPVLGAMLVTDVALALATRLVPQLQPFYIGLPVKVGLGLLVVLLALPVWVSTVSGLFDSLPREVLVLFGGHVPQ